MPGFGRGSGWTRTATIVAGALAVIGAGCSAVSSSASQASSSSTTTTAGSSTTVAVTPTPTTPSGTFHVGATQAIAQTAQNPAMQATLVQIIDPAQSADPSANQFSDSRYVAVQMQLGISGSTSFSDDPNLDTVVDDAQGQPYASVSTSLQGCPPFATGGLFFSPNKQKMGCVTFQLPLDATVSEIDFTPGRANFASPTAQWQVP